MATTSCFYIYIHLITTLCDLGGPFLPFRNEPQGFGFPAGRTPDNNQAPGLKSMQTMTDVALVPWQGPYEVLMTAPNHAAGALVIRRSPLEDTFLPSGEALCGHRGPLLACGARETGGRHIEGDQILLLDDRQWTGELPVVTELQDHHASELRDHHEGRRPLRRFLVPSC